MQTKKCTVCGKEKDIHSFHRDYNPSWCIQCLSEYKQKWREKKPFNDILQAIRHRCRNSKYRVSKNSLTAKDIASLWVRDKATDMDVPCIHRIDNEKGYSLSNCRFVEKVEHDRISSSGKKAIWV